jgi:hypothetical protein
METRRSGNMETLKDVENMEIWKHFFPNRFFISDLSMCNPLAGIEQGSYCRCPSPPVGDRTGRKYQYQIIFFYSRYSERLKYNLFSKKFVLFWQNNSGYRHGESSGFFCPTDH